MWSRASRCETNRNTFVSHLFRYLPFSTRQRLSLKRSLFYANKLWRLENGLKCSLEPQATPTCKTCVENKRKMWIKTSNDQQISIPDLCNLKLCVFIYRCWVAHEKVYVFLNFQYFFVFFSSLSLITKSNLSQSSTLWEMNVSWRSFSFVWSL